MWNKNEGKALDDRDHVHQPCALTKTQMGFADSLTTAR